MKIRNVDKINEYMWFTWICLTCRSFHNTVTTKVWFRDNINGHCGEVQVVKEWKINFDVLGSEIFKYTRSPYINVSPEEFQEALECGDFETE